MKRPCSVFLVGAALLATACEAIGNLDQFNGATEANRGPSGASGGATTGSGGRVVSGASGAGAGGPTGPAASATSGIGQGSGSGGAAGITTGGGAGVATGGGAGVASGGSGSGPSQDPGASGNAPGDGPDGETASGADDGGAFETPQDDAIAVGPQGGDASRGPQDATANADGSSPLNPDASGATPPADASAGGSYCAINAAPHMTFCRDFDDGQPYGYGFSSWRSSGIPSPALTGTDFVSSPEALVLPTPSLQANATASNQMVVHIRDHWHIELWFSLKIAGFDPAVGDLSLVRIVYDTGSWGVNWDLARSATVFETLSTSGGAGTTTAHHGIMPALNRWINVVFAVDLNAKTVSLTADGTTLASGTIAPPPLLGSVAVIVGFNFLAGPAKPMTLTYDNVAIITE